MAEKVTAAETTCADMMAHKKSVSSAMTAARTSLTMTPPSVSPHMH